MTTLTPCDTSLVLNALDGSFDWCVWGHYIVPNPGDAPTLIMVGACKLCEVYNLADGKSNSEWKRIFANGGSVLVRIIAITPEKNDAFREATRLMKTHVPTCNVRGHNVKHMRRSIRCINNDKRYNTQADAARDLGLDQGSISRHLRGHLRSVHGFMFEYSHGDQ